MRNLVRKTFTADGSWTAPAGVKSIKVSVFRDNVFQLTAGYGGGSTNGSNTAIDATGVSYSWGSNGGDNGNLGNNSLADFSSPSLVSGGFSFLQCKQGTHGLWLRDTGDVYGCAGGSGGAFTVGQIGDNTITARSTPTLMVGGRKIRFIAAGSNTSFIVDSTGSAFSCGINNSGQLGDNSTTNRSSPVALSGTTKWKQIAGGSDHTLGIDDSGNLWAWGSNASGQFGNNATSPNSSSPVQITTGLKFRAVQAGITCSYGITESNDLYAWGSNNSGRLGLNDTVNRSTPTLVVGGKKWSEVSVCPGGSTGGVVMALSTDGVLYGFGINSNGQLGDNTTSARSSPTAVVGSLKFVTVAAGQVHCIALGVNGNMYGWGNNSVGQVGDNTITNRSSPVVVVGSKSWLKAPSVLVNEIPLTVVPGTSYTISAFAPMAKLGQQPLGFSRGYSKVVLEYYA